MLQSSGINAADLTKLKAAGFCTCASIMMATKKELIKVKGITEAKIEKIQEIATKIERAGFVTATEV